MAAARKASSPPSFEDSLHKLEAIVKRLEEEEIPLEASLKLFAEGQLLHRACEAQLSAAENQVRVLLESESGKIEAVPLDLGEVLGEEESNDDEASTDEAPIASLTVEVALESKPEAKPEPARTFPKDELPF